MRASPMVAAIIQYIHFLYILRFSTKSFTRVSTFIASLHFTQILSNSIDPLFLVIDFHRNYLFTEKCEMYLVFYENIGCIEM